MEIKELREHLIRSPEIKAYLDIRDFDYYTDIDVDFIDKILELERLASKQIPKKVNHSALRNTEPTKCPSCEEELSTLTNFGCYRVLRKFEFCPDCGQALKW